MNTLWLYRVFTLALTCIFSLAVIGTSTSSAKHLGQITWERLGSSLAHPFTSWATMVGSGTLATSVVMLVLDYFIDGIITSAIAFEILWASVLWALWIVVGSRAVSDGKTLFGQLSCADFDRTLPQTASFCHELYLVSSLAFATFALLFVYAGVLYAVCCSGFGAAHGTPVWKTSLKNRTKYQLLL
ncbi:hypothetical protein C8Q78DRAFT_501876 [Trametes maxima]|nr:hypothetical protein C8Q78DRAFT_501876 [Trametes maxima]